MNYRWARHSVAPTDSDGRTVKTTDADNRTVWYQYDDHGRPTQTVYKWLDQVGGTPDIYTKNTYMSCCGLLESQRDPSGDKTYYAYDPMKRVSKVWSDVQTREWAGVHYATTGDPSTEVTNGSEYEGNPVVAIGYDDFGRKSTVSTYASATTQPAVTTYGYDSNGRVTSVTYPSPIAASEYGYDSVGNVLYVKGGPESTYFTAKYDSLDRPTDVYLTGSSTLPNPLPSGTGDIRIAYDGASNLVTDVWRNPDKHVTYSYDEFGRLKTYKPTSGPIAGVNLWYKYNDLGQKKEVKILNGTGGTVHDTAYDYYPNGLLKAINYDGGKVAEYSYGPAGLLAQIDFYSGGSATGAYDVYSYDTSDPRNLLKTITMHYKDAAGQPTSSMIDYRHPITGDPNVDKAGNQLTMDNLVGHWAYTYDHGGRVLSIISPNPVPEQELGGTYGYNWLGQMISPPAEPNHLTYNEAGLPESWPGLYSYTYKSNGMPWQVKNPSGSASIASITYDPAGFPNLLSVGGFTTQPSWDADGTPLGYTETVGGSETGSSLTDPASPAGSVLMDNESGNTVSYVCDPQGCVVASVSTAGQADYHSDANGQIQASTASNGKVAATYAHGPNGSVVSTTDPLGPRATSLSRGLLEGAFGGATGVLWDRLKEGFQRVLKSPARELRHSITLRRGTPTLQTLNPTLQPLCDNRDIASVVNVLPEAGRTAGDLLDGSYNTVYWTEEVMEAALLGAGGPAVGGEALAAEGSAALRGQRLVQVSSWAPEGVESTLAPGRYVVLGGPTRLNYVRTGIWEPNWLPGARPTYPYPFRNDPLVNNVGTWPVQEGDLVYPPGEWWKGWWPWNQRVYRPR